VTVKYPPLAIAIYTTATPYNLQHCERVNAIQAHPYPRHRHQGFRQKKISGGTKKKNFLKCFFVLSKSGNNHPDEF
jgi:hypothetical protein